MNSSPEVPPVKPVEEVVKVDLSRVSPPAREALLTAMDRCIRCNTCKSAFSPLGEQREGYESSRLGASCPSGERFQWEAFWASGRIRLARAFLTGKLVPNDACWDPAFACTTCGHCQDNCQAPHADRIVEMIEALREYVVRTHGPPPPLKGRWSRGLGVNATRTRNRTTTGPL
ncbi:MAG: hypothetical protein Kow0069_18100 [Promethearchaeota archaeon]